MLTQVIAKLVLTTQGAICSRCKEAIILANSGKKVCVGIHQAVFGFDAKGLIQLRIICCQILPNK